MYNFCGMCECMCGRVKVFVHVIKKNPVYSKLILKEETCII